MIKREKNEYAIQAVENSLNVLEQFTGDKAELGITEISRELRLHKNNVFRVLATLQNRGYIEQNPRNENYRLGTKVLELSRAFLDHTGLNKVAQPMLKKLADRINENAYLGLLKSSQVVYVEHAESHQVLRVTSRIGRSISPLCTAIGKVILAYMPEQEIERVIEKNGFKQHTSNTIVDKAEFLRTLADIQKKATPLTRKNTTRESPASVFPFATTTTTSWRAFPFRVRPAGSSPPNWRTSSFPTSRKRVWLFQGRSVFWMGEANASRRFLKQAPLLPARGRNLLRRLTGWAFLLLFANGCTKADDFRWGLYTTEIYGSLEVERNEPDRKILILAVQYRKMFVQTPSAGHLDATRAKIVEVPAPGSYRLLMDLESYRQKVYFLSPKHKTRALESSRSLGIGAERFNVSLAYDRRWKTNYALVTRPFLTAFSNNTPSG